MKITLAAVMSKGVKQKAQAVDEIAADYVRRASRYMVCEEKTFGHEALLLQSLDHGTGRTPTRSIFLDSAGELLTSERFAAHVGIMRDQGAQRLLVAVGPADGWSIEAKGRADLLFSLGRITLPHGLARAIAAEQIYRSLTILAGHPYHCGH